MTKKLVAPDGGWGYMICLGYTILYAVCNAPTNSFGMIFKDFFEKDNQNAQYVTAIQGLCGILISLSGLTVHVLLKWFSLRQLAVIGSICYSINWFIDIFITSVSHMLFTNGFLNGLGFGLINAVSCTIINEYFIKKRVMMMSICLSVVGIVSIASPFIFKFLLEYFGFRGTLALIAAISANTLVGSALYQPVEWHLVQSEDDEANIDDPNSIDKNLQLEPLVEHKELDVTPPLDQNRAGAWKAFYKYFNLKLMKNFTFINVFLAMSIGMIGDSQFITLLPLILYENNLTTTEVATCLSIVAIADLISRILLVILSRFFKISSCSLYYSMLVLVFIGRILFLQFSSFYSLASILAFLGFLRAWVFVPYPLLCAEALPNENYVSTFGLSSLMGAIYSTILSPTLGGAHNITGSYKGTFYVLAFSHLFSIIPWTVQYIMNLLKKRV